METSEDHVRIDGDEVTLGRAVADFIRDRARDNIEARASLSVADVILACHPVRSVSEAATTGPESAQRDDLRVV
jgi:hypothetical protein